MKIVVLNGSPRVNGNTAAMTKAFAEGAASPIYYHGFSAQLQCAIHSFYAPGLFPNFKKAALFLTSGEDGVYDGAEFEYNGCFIKYWGLQDMGIFKILEDCDDFTKFNEFGRSLA